ncbi:type II secretion system protein [Grimontia hollisae]|uniref:type II secretion system protein n=1 Tax=Grimontia hollisae TaxID=673 RepID=UPI0013039E78|nr:type II secretion system protein [Grimontia hollisae]
MKRQGGFTLIEMIVVIVILGILAVTAAPKFLNFTTEAKAATLKGVEAAIQSAANITHGKFVLGQSVDGVTFEQGYPSGETIAKAFTLSGDMEEFETAPDGYDTAFGFVGDTSSTSTCFVGYKEAKAAGADPIANPATIFSTEVVSTGCN